MAVDIDDKKLDGKGLSDLWGIIKQYVAQHGSGVVPATEDTLGGIMVGSTLSITNAGVLNLPTLVTASTFRSVSVDAYGRVVGGTNPTTLAAYGITDAKIENGVITLGGNTITPITSLSGYATQSWVQQQGYTTNIGTVTQVKVGSTAYNPSSGVVSLPAYPTSLPASDVYSWAKASSKPSYTLDEVGDGGSRKLSNYLPLSGGTITGNLTLYSESGASPYLYFQRGSLDANNLTDYRIFVTEGDLHIQDDYGSSSFSDVLVIRDGEDAMYYKGKQVLCLDQTYSSYNPAYAKVRSILIGGGTYDFWSPKSNTTYTTDINLDNIYLKLSGGTMSGQINMPSGASISNGSGVSGHYMLTWDGSSTLIGSTQGASYVRSSGDNLYHRTSAGNDYKILDTNNYSSCISTRNLVVDGTSYTVYSPYTTQVTINTTSVTQTVTTSNNTDKRPILVGASSSSAEEPSFSTTTNSVYAAHRLFMQPSTGDLFLYSPSGDSPALYFQRGIFSTSEVFDWRIFVSSGDLLIQNTNGGWSTKFYFSSDGYLGIGTTSPSYKLHVAGSLYASTYYNLPFSVVHGTMNSGTASGSHYYYLPMSFSNASKCIFTYIMGNAYEYQSGCYTCHAGNGLADTMAVKYVTSDTYNGAKITNSWLVTTGGFDAGNVYYNYVLIP